MSRGEMRDRNRESVTHPVSHLGTLSHSVSAAAGDNQLAPKDVGAIPLLTRIAARLSHKTVTPRCVTLPTTIGVVVSHIYGLRGKPIGYPTPWLRDRSAAGLFERCWIVPVAAESQSGRPSEVYTVWPGLWGDARE